MNPILSISIYQGHVHIGCDVDGCAYTPQEPGQSEAYMVEFFEGGSVMAMEQIGHTLKTPAIAFQFAEALDNFGRAGIALMLCGYVFRDGEQRDQAANHLRRCSEAAEAYAAYAPEPWEPEYDQNAGSVPQTGVPESEH